MRIVGCCLKPQKEEDKRQEEIGVAILTDVKVDSRVVAFKRIHFSKKAILEFQQTEMI